MPLDAVPQRRAVILLSGGLDSTVTAAVAKQEGCDLFLLTIAYRQRHAIEIEQAKQVAASFGVQHHQVVEVDLRALGGSALTGNLAVPKDRKEQERTQGIPITYVPARNLIFLSLAAAHAEVVGASVVYFGANVLDYSGYPDCRPEFIRAFEQAVAVGTKSGVEGTRLEVRAPLLTMSKAEIIQLGMTLHAPLHLTHSCYDPVGSLACGHCDSCLIRRQGFAQAGVEDPVAYAVR
ncbi:7-cyano-7-deazaguanine synthase QueC [Nitrospira lenta]|uniref:7-cyano-7-deazaguanine synthase n=1 Tax=Nitrospira lenta TaxID=1436998 RepID=A0A330KZS7_9BACT|nr:7-cyano-7-deazaguanine synthase QueC [Nitrospira lenta]SPP63031.1 7-cyano-7-deazaguanine synthase [Nitrospira lenta]